MLFDNSITSILPFGIKCQSWQHIAHLNQPLLSVLYSRTGLQVYVNLQISQLLKQLCTSSQNRVETNEIRSGWLKCWHVTLCIWVNRTDSNPTNRASKPSGLKLLALASRSALFNAIGCRQIMNVYKLKEAVIITLLWIIAYSTSYRLSS